MNQVNINILYDPNHKWISENKKTILDFVIGRGDEITYFINDDVKATTVRGNFFGEDDEKTIRLDFGKYYIHFNSENQIIVKLPEFDSLIFNLYLEIK